MATFGWNMSTCRLGGETISGEDPMPFCTLTQKPHANSKKDAVLIHVSIGIWPAPSSLDLTCTKYISYFLPQSQNDRKPRI